MSIMAFGALSNNAVAEPADVPTLQMSTELPELLKDFNGAEITTVEQWKVHREALFKMFSSEMYGVMPDKPAMISYHLFESDNNALDGLATRRQYEITMSNGDYQTKMDLLVYIPNKRPETGAPLFMTMNFKGNHALSMDPAVRICQKPMGSDTKDVKPRGDAQSRWALKMIMERGYALATIARGDVAWDGKNQPTNNVLGLFPELQKRNDNFTTIGAWAWAQSRALDYLVTLPEIDASKLIAMGHSRLGKTALWLGVTDPRIAIAISNDSGEGGAALTHRMQGETVADLCRNFPYWFTKNFQKYVKHDKEMPFDQYQLISLIAPRHVYVASAQGDAWADPEGEFTSLKLANPAFALYGIKDALPTETMPEVENPVQGHNGYHIRKGKHDVTDYDWARYLDFADKHFGMNK